ncbi:hypothetical protein CGMCC3_g11338 [Colletotrichum fructicola]|nr:uncharacterized protein CGMCC3_g11338 [Colletotrichum fructicola]KAE9572614.1 hypothetical protein CGMCC3_g11338 [Colletotrichum fructicola]
MAETNIQAEVPPEADVTGDTDSSLGQDDFSATTSLRSSIIDYRVENGRTYHRYKEGKYFGPNDEDESNRLDLQHHLFLLTFDKRIRSFGNPARVVSFNSHCFENLKPGGYVELQEAESNIFSADGICERGAFYKSLSYVASALEVFGCPFIPLDTLTSLLPEAGFVEVTDRRFIWPLNTWPRDPYLKELGSWSRENLASNTAEVQVFAAEVRKDLSDRGNHGYWPIRAIWAKKPSE